ncbi:hypothetical protein BJ508DRAFT_54720 [Ascobolus immersus RN42]|uniref:Uncharacterized protein n=1 Tax=Ascobolus immersus RN42 TaxID=1160509 RepID=A0A3N4HGC2_ASCIM|nr:hypothetical protein BJ508DRAFT_54720 [Ascobolus immersus RN42]
MHTCVCRFGTSPSSRWAFSRRLIGNGRLHLVHSRLINQPSIVCGQPFHVGVVYVCMVTMIFVYMSFSFPSISLFLAVLLFPSVIFPCLTSRLMFDSSL